jgi:hypothetical protein
VKDVEIALSVVDSDNSERPFFHQRRSELVIDAGSFQAPQVFTNK